MTDKNIKNGFSRSIIRLKIDCIAKLGVQMGLQISHHCLQKKRTITFAKISRKIWHNFNVYDLTFMPVARFSRAVTSFSVSTLNRRNYF